MHEEIPPNEVPAIGQVDDAMDWNVSPQLDPRHMRKFYEFLRNQTRERIAANEEPPIVETGS